ncbi:MAG: ankyrin repeat domain-containing protein [Gemmatimonadales bacterium]|nr:ankyrin repeat domain-containing protein [Gemmatimonadales bacterium]
MKKSILIISLTVLLATNLSMLTPTGLQAGEIHDSVAAGDLDQVRALLEEDSTLMESKGNTGFTPLHTACFTGQVAIANYLLDNGADIKSHDIFQYIPLHRACYFPDPDRDLILRLIDMGSSVNAKGIYGATPLHWAAYRGGPNVATLLLEKGAEINVMEKNGISPLHRAAQSGDIEVAKILIAHGADVNISDKYTGPVRPNDITGTALQIAINYSPKEEMATLLLDNGAEFNRKDSLGNTELHLAAMKGNGNLARALCGHGAEVNAVNDFNRTPLYYAAKHGYRSVAEVLITAGAKENTIVEINYGKAPQLTEKLEYGEAYLWHLGYSFAVKTKENLLVFTLTNNIKETPEAGLANGYLNSHELEDLKITMFLRHRDRFHMGAEDFNKLAKLVPGVNVITSFTPDFDGEENSDIPAYRLAAPNESFTVDGVTVHTIPALGGGMGYLVEADGVKVFHAGLHVSDNVAENVEKYRKEIDYLKPFGPIDVAVMAAYSHNNRVGIAYENYLYLIDQLAPKAIYLFGANNQETYPNCVEILEVRNIPVVYPEVKPAKGERFHYRRDLKQ